MAYLRGRGIEQWPDGTVAYVPSGVLTACEGLGWVNHHALVIWGSNDAGEIVAGQRVLIDREGQRILAPDKHGDLKNAAKLSFAGIGGAPARLSARGDSTDLIVAEGPETALAIWQVVGCEVWAVFGAGQFKTAPLPLDRRVILAPDQDAADSSPAKAFDEALAHHRATHPDLWVARAPEPIGSKDDLNDTLVRAGADAVLAAVNAAVFVSANQAAGPVIVRGKAGQFTGQGATMRPAAARQKVMEVGVARTRLRSEVRGGLRRSGVTLIEATLGLGKTHATIAELVDLLDEAKRSGIVEPAAMVALPTHRLGRQVLADIKSAAPGKSVVQLYGAEAQDPDDAASTVCKRLDEYRELASLLLDTAPLCEACPFASSCLHLSSKAEKADIYVTSHEPLKSARTPLKAGQTLVATVVDESPMNALVNDKSRAVPLAAMLAAPVKIRTKAGEMNRLAAEADLRAFRLKLEDLICAHGPGYLRLPDLSKWTAADARAAYSLEWQRKINDETDPEVKGNKTLPILSGIYTEIQRSIEGEVEVNARVHIREGEMGLEVVLSGLKPFSEVYRKAPVLMLDATANADVAGLLAGGAIAHHATIRARENIVIEQDPNLTGAKSFFFAGGKQTGNVARVRRYIAMLSMDSRTVAISNKEAVAAMGLPDHIQAAHFNALRGLNTFSDADTLVIAGRPLPSPDDLRRMVAAIWGTPCVGTIKPDSTVWRLVVVGGVIMEAETKTATHEDPRAQTLLSMIRDAEVMQAIGRLRAVNRAAPVRCILLSDAVIDYPVQLVDLRGTLWSCDVIGEMLEQGGVAFLSPSHASGAYPDLYKDRQAADGVFKRLTDLSTFSIRGLYGKRCQVVSVRRPRGQIGMALVHPSISDIEAAIKALIPDGQIVRIERPQAKAETEAAPTSNVIPFLRDGVLDLNLAAPEAGESHADTPTQTSATRVNPYNPLVEPLPLPPRTDGPHGLPAPGAIEKDEELMAVPHMSIHGAEYVIYARKRPTDEGSNAPRIRYEPLDMEAIPAGSTKPSLWPPEGAGVRTLLPGALGALIYGRLLQRPPLTAYVAPASVFSGYLARAA